MNKDGYTYLTDEELNDLIEDVELNSLYAAPPDLISNVLAGIEGREDETASDNIIELPPLDSTETATQLRNNVAEFRRFSLRVAFAVAAAIAIIVIAPILAPRGSVQYVGKIGDFRSEDNTIPSKDEVVKDIQIPTREEFLNRNEITDMVMDSHRISDLYRETNR